MNTIHNNGENDQALNDGLEKLGQAYGRLEQDEPPELLDQAILNNAHRAVEKKSGWKDFGWVHGLATAAVFVLAFTIILDQRELAPEFKAPESRDDVLRNAPLRTNGERALKKQSVDKIGKSNVEMEARDEPKQKSMMEAEQGLTAPATAAMELSVEDKNAQLPQAELRRQRVQSSVVEKNEHADKDDTTTNYLQEEIMMDEADVLTEAPPLDAASIKAMPAAVAEPVSSEIKARGRMDSTIELELQAIIELKKTGDQTWVTELEAFVKRYPDYPLPDELKN
jgi:hypothetical protein